MQCRGVESDLGKALCSDRCKCETSPLRFDRARRDRDGTIEKLVVSRHSSSQVLPCPCAAHASSHSGRRAAQLVQSEILLSRLAADNRSPSAAEEGEALRHHGDTQISASCTEMHSQGERGCACL